MGLGLSGVRAARLHVDDTDELEQADAECAEREIRWGSLLVPVPDITLTNVAVRRGFDIVDVRTTLAMELNTTHKQAAVDIAREGDADQMADIASTAFGASRFFVDDHLDDLRCKLFYETWARNSLNGKMADAVVVSRDQDNVDGFITLRLRSDRSASLSLVAIREDRRGLGVGHRLLGDTLGWLVAQDYASVDVVTQASNVPAVRLYEKFGFRTTETGFWLHRWY